MNTDNIENLIHFVKNKIEWRKKDPFQKGWGFEIIQQNKNIYEKENTWKFMSNSLARVCTPLFIPYSERLKRPGCLAIHLDFKKSNRDFDKFELTKINFSSKREINETQIRLLKILKYCFGVEEPFLDNYVKNYLKSKLSTIIKPKIVQDCSNANKCIEDLEFLNDMKNNLAEKEIVEIAENNLKLSKDLHYLMIICSDLIVLPDIFKRYFIKPENFESI